MKSPPRRRSALTSLAAALLPLLSIGFIAPAAAQDRADIDRTQIIGNRELPKVLTIVPWKKPMPGDLAGRPATSLLDELLSPVDRDVFRRQVAYDAQLQPRTTPSNPTTSVPRRTLP
jgi:hypothetical protein